MIKVRAVFNENQNLYYHSVQSQQINASNAMNQSKRMKSIHVTSVKLETGSRYLIAVLVN